MNYFVIHVSTLALNFISLFLLRGVVISHDATYFILAGILAGFFISWYKKGQKLSYLELLKNTLSIWLIIPILSLVISLIIWLLVELFRYQLSFLDLLQTSVRLLIALQCYHSFMLRREKDYVFNQTITIPLVVSSIVLSRESPNPYINYYLVVYLFLWIIALSFGILLRKKETASKTIEALGSESFLLLRRTGLILLLFLTLLIFSRYLSMSIFRPERPSFGIIPAIWGVPEEEKPESQEAFPIVGSALRRPMGVLIKKNRVPEPLIGTSPGPGISMDVIKEETRGEESDSQDRLTKYTQKGKADDKEYKMTRFDITYNEQNKTIRYSEVGTYDNKPYQLTRDKINYDAQGNVTSYNEKGRLGNEEYELRVEFDSHGRITKYTQKGKIDSKEYQISASGIVYDQENKLVAYSEIGTYDGKPYELTRDKFTYDAQGNMTSYHEKGVRGGKKYEFTKVLQSPQGESEKPEEQSQEQQTAQEQQITQEQQEMQEEQTAEEQSAESEISSEEELKSGSVTRVILRYLSYLLLLLLLLILFLALYLLFLYLRHKIAERRLQLLLFQNPALFIIEIYKSISDILRIYNCRRLIWMVPEEYLAWVSKKQEEVTDNFELVTEKFLEARYSFHTLTTQSSFSVGINYRKIIERLKTYGGRWQNLLTYFKKFNIQVSENR